MNNEMKIMLNILTLVWWEQGVIWAADQHWTEYSLPVQLCHIPLVCVHDATDTGLLRHTPEPTTVTIQTTQTILTHSLRDQASAQSP